MKVKKYFWALNRKKRLELRDALLIRGTWQMPFMLVTHDADEAKVMGDPVLFLGKGLKTESQW